LKRIPQLDGLRGAAIALVMLRHFIFQTHPTMPDALAAVVFPVTELGWSGVDLFFILSGFLIGGILVDARDSANYYRAFYLRRAFRILPIYLLLVLAGFFLALLGPRAGETLGNLVRHPAPWLYYLTFTQNFYFAWHSDTIWFFQITWSLAVEEQFYLTLPLLIRKIPAEKILAASVGMVAVIALLRSALYWNGSINGMQAYELPFFRFDSLFIGVACAMAIRSPNLHARLRKHSRLLAATALALGAVFFFMDHDLQGRSRFLHTVGFTVIGLFFAAVMLLVLVRPEGTLARSLCFRPLMRLGTISYCVYLIHGITLSVVAQMVFLIFRLSGAATWAAIILGTGATFLLAQGSWQFFESRMIASGHRLSYEGGPAPQTAADPS